MDYEIQKFISEKEDQYFDRKSARIKPRDIIKHIVAFANADGGKLVIGIEDDGTISGFKFQGAIDPDEYVLAINSMTKPNPTFKKEMKSIKNARGEDDILFIIDVEPSISHVIFNSNGDCFLRIGDKSVHQTHDQISKLEYDKGQRMFEDIEILDSTLDDIDESLMDSYKKLKKLKRYPQKPYSLEEG